MIASCRVSSPVSESAAARPEPADAAAETAVAVAAAAAVDENGDCVERRVCVALP